ELEAAGEVLEPAHRAARVVVEHAHADARVHQAARQRAAEKTGSAGHQIRLPRHIFTFPPRAVAEGMRTMTGSTPAPRARNDWRTPHTNQRRYSTVHVRTAKVDLPPYSRSIDTIGTSPRRRPARCALMPISNATAQPTGRASSCRRSNSSGRNILIPVVASVSRQPESVRNVQFAARDRRPPTTDPPSRRPPCA